MDVSAEDWRRLTDDRLEVCIVRLTEAVCDKDRLDPNISSGRTNVADGGVDIRVELPHGQTSSAAPWLLPNAVTGIQCKMSIQPNKIEEEVLAGGEPKASIAAVLEKGGHYVLASGKSLTDTEIKNRKESLDAALGKWATSDRLHVIHGGQLASLSRNYPSMWLHVHGGQSHHASDFDEWSMSDVVPPPSFQTDDDLHATMEAIRAFIDGEGSPNVLVLAGEAGRGKTRLLQEAIAGARRRDQTIYAHSADRFLSGDYFQWIVSQNRGRGIVVLDNATAENQREMLSNAGRTPEVRYVIVTRSQAPPRGAELVSWNGPSAEVCAKIMKDIAPSADQTIWKWGGQASAGYPLLAVQLAERIQQENTGGRQDWLDLGDAEMFRRLLPPPPTGKDAEIAALVRYLAVFDRLGIKGEGKGELHWVCDQIGLNRVVAEQYLDDLRRFGMIDGDFYVALRPFVMRVHFIRDFFRLHCATSDDLIEFLESVSTNLGPTQAAERIMGALAYVGTTPEGRELLVRLWGADGLFPDLQALEERAATFRLRSLVEGAPDLALDAFKRILKDKTDEGLIEGLKSARFAVVSSLEIIAMWGDLFEDAARLLGRLGIAENQSYANNARGTFKGLFSPGIGGMAVTELPGPDRLPVLKEMLDSSPDEQTLAIEACTSILETHQVRWVGGEIQGGYLPPKMWSPDTWRPVIEFVQGSWRALRQHSQSGAPTAALAGESMCSKLRGVLARYPDLREEALDGIEEILVTGSENYAAALDALVSVLAYDTEALPNVLVSRIRDMEHRFGRESLRGRLFRFVFLSPVSDRVDREGREKPDVEAEIREVAGHLLGDFEENRALLDELTEARGNVAWFGYHLGVQDKQAVAGDYIKARSSEDSAWGSVLHSYLVGLLDSGSDSGQAFWEQLHADEAYQCHAVRAAIGRKDVFDDVATLSSMIRANPNCVDPNLRFSLKGLETPERDEVVKTILDVETPGANRLALQLTSLYGVEKGKLVGSSSEIALRCFLRFADTLSPESSNGDGVGYEANSHDWWQWGQVGQACVAASPESCGEILAAVRVAVEAVDRPRLVDKASDVVNACAAANPEACQDVIESWLHEGIHGQRVVVDLSGGSSRSELPAWYLQLDRAWFLEVLGRLDEDAVRFVVGLLRLPFPGEIGDEEIGENLLVKLYERFSHIEGFDASIFNASSRTAGGKSMSDIDERRHEAMKRLAGMCHGYKISGWFQREADHSMQSSRRWREHEERREGPIP